MLTVGALGYRNHAARMIDLVNARDDAQVLRVCHPTKGEALDCGTTRIEDLLDCDAVMILSPTDVHFEQLRFFAENFDGYVLCEKPPVSTMEELVALEALGLDPGRTFFNFNQRFGLVRAVAEKALADGTVGTPILASSMVGHGLAFKEGYETSWRADANRQRHGVAETLAIHYVDLMTHLLGPLADVGYRSWNVSGRGTADDTCHFSLRFEGGAQASVAASYAQPYAHRFMLVGTEGVVEYRKGALTVSAPRDSFDQRGFFTHAPEVLREEIDENDIYKDSLGRALDAFLGHCARGEAFPAAWYETSIATNRVIVELP